MARGRWRQVVAGGVILAVAGGGRAAGDGLEVPTLAPVVVTAEAEPAPGPFLPPIQGTALYAGKKTAVIDLEAPPVIVNNNYRQALVRTPGLLVSEETTPLLSVGYRGLEPHRAQFTQVLQDGVPIHADMFGYPEAYYIPSLHMVDRIEFVHGGAALLYGPQPGGALNYVTRQPAERGLAVQSHASWGSYGAETRYGGASGTVGPLGYVGYAEHRRVDGYRDANSDFDAYSGGGHVVVSPSDPDRWILGYDAYQEEHGEPGGLTKAQFERDPTVTTRFNDRFRLDRHAVMTAYERVLGPDTVGVLKAFTGYYKRYSRRQRTSGSAFGGLPSGATASTNTIEIQRFSTVGVEPRVRHTYALLGQPGQAISAGLLYYHVTSPRVDQRGTTADADRGNVRNRSDRSVDDLSLFAEHRFQVARLGITPGARLEHIWQAVDEKVNLDKTSSGRALGDVQEFDVVPLLGLGADLDLGHAVTAYGNVSQAYRPKIFTQAVPTGGTTVINRDLEEGRSWQADVGVRGQPVPYWFWDTSAFRLDFDNQIGTVGVNIENLGRSVHRGVELASTVDLVGAAVAVTGRELVATCGALEVFGNAMFLDAEFENGPTEGLSPQYTPGYVVRTGVTLRPLHRAKVALTGTFVEEHFADDAHTANRRIPAYNVWDLTGELEVLPDHVALVGGINNLFDDAYFSRVRSDGIDPGLPRNYYGGVEVQVAAW